MAEAVEPTKRAFLAGAGDMAHACRDLDWRTTPLGAAESWPAVLKMLTPVLLASPQPMFMVWGASRTFLFNDAYLPLLGARREGALGRGFFEVWPELAGDVGPLMQTAFGGQPMQMDDITLVLHRHGAPEEAHFAFSYTPIRDESGVVAGLLCVLNETTEEVFGRRRQQFRLDLEAKLRDLTDPAQIVRTAQAALGLYFGASRVGYGEVDFEARYFTTADNWTDGTVGHHSGVHDLSAFGPDIHRGLKSGRSLRINDVLSDAPEAIPAFEALEMRSAMTVSLIKDGRMRAALYVHDRKPRLWSDADQRIAEETADRTWAAVARARAEGQVASVLESMTDGFVLLDRQFRVIRANAEAQRLDGRPSEKMIGVTIWDLWPGLEGSNAGRSYKLALQTETPVSVEHEYPVGGADARWFEARAYPSPEGLAIFYRDISDRRQADAWRRKIEAELRESEEQLRIAQRAGQIGSFELFPERGKIAVSEEFCRLWGVPYQREFDTRTFLDQIEPSDLERISTGASTVDSAALEYIEYRIRKADTGEARWMARRGEVLTDSAGRRRYLGVSYDITVRKRAELALQTLNETLEAQVAERTAERDRMWRLSTDIMLVASFDATIVAVNPAWSQVFDWSEAELIGRSFLELVHPEDVEVTGREAGRLSEGLTTLRFENRYRGKDGEYRWISWTAVPDEGFIHAVGRDVTSEKQAAAELELAQSALRQAQKMEAVGQLTGGIAHDFNNLLTGVLGSLDLLTRRVQQGRIGDIDRYVTAASKSATRAAALTQRLLAFSRRQPLDPKATDANRLLRGMDELLRRTLGERIALEFVAAGGLWTTLCDPHQLESAVLNLAINARDAMPDGGRLTIETCNTHLDDAYAAREQQVKPGQYVCISVSDTGGGIPPEMLERVIEPFFTTKPIGQGTGLGLSMIYGFAQQSEGYLKIYSEVGTGTTVKLYLPRYYGSPEEMTEAGRAGLVPQEAERDAVVLVVEDEDAVRDVVCEVLSELGCTTLEGFDGPSGLQIIQSDQRIDLLVTDIGLPGMNGRLLADAAREARPGLKVLFMTGYAENATLASGFLEPGMEMMTKPFAVAALSSKLRDMLEG